MRAMARYGRWAIRMKDRSSGSLIPESSPSVVRSMPPWARGASGGRQVLVCPVCQVERDDWLNGLDGCERCGSTRLSVLLGEVTCRQCGYLAGSLDGGEWRSGSGA